MMRYYYFAIIALSFLGCKTQNKPSEMELGQPTDVRKEVEVANPEIVFLYFDIEEKGEEKIEIRLTQKQVSDGRMKKNTVRQASKTDGNLIVHLLDENNQVQVEQIVENPLFRTIEQYSEEGEITLSQLDLEKTQFFIRFNNKSTIKALKIYSIQSGRPVVVYNKPIQL
ncbi:MAG TPA: hypothetical protein VKX30_02815 [Flavobacteriaceae bacterium]|nr:hypothetical protein [Flavobacteriaceae bacterium]